MYENPMWVSGHIEPGKFFEEVTRRFSELMRATKKSDIITVLINSDGGDTHTTLGIYDLLRTSGRQTTGIVTGRAESGASLVLQACGRRIVTRHSTLMLHHSNVRFPAYTAIENVQRGLDVFKRLDQRLYEIYAERTRKSVDAIAEMARSDTYFDAEQAVSFGLADEVLDDAMFYGHEPALVRLLLTPVTELDLSVRSANCLVNANIALIGELVQRTEAEMLKTRRFGRKSLNEIKEILCELKLCFGMVLDEDLQRRIASAHT